MKIGLVLSGGGAKGVAHIGAIKALEEYGISPSHIAGTSSGAIVGLLYANDMEWLEMLHFFKKVLVFQVNRFAYGKPGFIDTEKFYDNFKKYFSEDDFKVLKKSLYVTATNVLDGSLKIFHKGELIRPVLASASFPGVFTPVLIDGSYYIDGGALNNFPVEPLKEQHCDKIIGVYVNPLKKIKIEDLKHSYTVFDRAYRIKIAAGSHLKFSDCDLVISPEKLMNFGTFDINSVDTIFNIGYAATKKILKKNKSVLKSFEL